MSILSILSRVLLLGVGRMYKSELLFVSVDRDSRDESMRVVKYLGVCLFTCRAFLFFVLCGRGRGWSPLPPPQVRKSFAFSISCLRGPQGIKNELHTLCFDEEPANGTGDAQAHAT